MTDHHREERLSRPAGGLAAWLPGSPDVIVAPAPRRVSVRVWVRLKVHVGRTLDHVDEDGAADRASR